MLIIIILLLFLIYNQFNKLIYVSKTIEAYKNYNDEQKKCVVVGTTGNYVYITRQKNINEPIEGAIWNIVDIRGNVIGTFKTDELGQGGIVGLECGEYFLEEQCIPEPYENINDYPVYDGRNVYEYWKETLNEEQQILYEEIKESYLQFKNDFSTQLNEISTKEFQEVYSTVLLDHAEIFWLDSYDNVQVDLLMN